ncbi:hypothetical protein [Ralstonia syzygii]|uniref:hypothetical protein n=1 Tax=Ralstonia syzygii TaxID=28097 RepID=UPI0018D03584|nr:hypothetical protein [Ralstonia syzygii]
MPVRDQALGIVREACLSAVFTMSAARHRSSNSAAIRGAITVSPQNYAEFA